MAYVLGFWYADGYMRKDRSYRILFYCNDTDILKQIRKALNSDHPIFLTKKQWSCHTLCVWSKQLYADLEKLGGISGKSKVMTFPAVPQVFLPDFIRGYFDGDGSVFFTTYRRTKDGKITKELRTNFTSGSRQFLERLMQILNTKLGLSIKRLGVFNNGGSLKLGYGSKDSDALLHYMYYDNFRIGLKRKAAFLSRIPKYQVHTFKARRDGEIGRHATLKML